MGQIACVSHRELVFNNGGYWWQVHLGLAQATYDIAPCGSYQVTVTFVPFAVDLRPSSASLLMNVTCT